MSRAAPNSQAGADPWMQTASGRRLHLLAPAPDQIDIRDIAAALAKACRFAGHTSAFYSVAQHSILVADLLPEPLALYGLLHDAHEAYLGDAVQPLKLALQALKGGRALAELASRLDTAIYSHFEMPWPLAEKDHRQLVQADLHMLATERRDLLAHHVEWDDSLPDPVAAHITPWHWSKAEEFFVLRFERARRARALRLAESH